MRRCPAIAAALACVLPHALPANWQYILADGENGYTGTRDVSVFSDFTSNASGRDPVLYVGMTQFADKRRAFIKFDLSVMPPGTIIERVQLELSVERARTGPEPHQLHRVTSLWDEGPATAPDSGAGGTGTPAASGDVTWTYANFPLVLWSQPGGEFDPLESAITSFGSAGTTGTFESQGMVGDVQLWVDDPGSNRGWILLGNEAGIHNAKRFHSSEAADPALRPRLKVTFRTPSAAANWQLYD